MTGDIDDQLPDHNRRAWGNDARAAEHGPDARHNFLRGKWLDDVVVRAQLETEDAIHLLIPGREHDDRERAGGLVPTQAATDFQTVYLRQHQIEKHQVRRRAPDPTEGVGAAATRRNLVAFALEVIREEITDVRLVLDDEHAACHAASILPVTSGAFR